MKGLAGKVIVAAGAATNIGAATARRLGAEGASVVVGDIDVDGARETTEAIRASGGQAMAVPYDQSDESSIAALIEEALSAHGRIDGLFANAADTRAVAQDSNLLDLDMEVWHRTLLVDLTGYALLIRAVLPTMVAAGSGSIVCTSSDASTIGERIRPAYGVAKAGVNALVRHVAMRWGRAGIRANAICPFALSAASLDRMDPSMVQRYRAGVPGTHIGDPAEIAPVVALLLSDDASYVNGQIWGVNGGATLRG